MIQNHIFRNGADPKTGQAVINKSPSTSSTPATKSSAEGTPGSAVKQPTLTFAVEYREVKPKPYKVAVTLMENPNPVGTRTLRIPVRSVVVTGGVNTVSEAAPDKPEPKTPSGTDTAIPAPPRSIVAEIAANGGIGLEPSTSPEANEPDATETPERLMEFHPLSEVFPMMGEDELKKLAEDIAENGLRESITTRGGKILDGRHRYLACQRAGVTPTFVEFVGDDPASFVVSKNIHRRHLTATQRAAIAAEFMPHFQEEAKKRKLAGRGADGSGGRGKKKVGNHREKIPGGLPAESNQDNASELGRARDKAAKAMDVNPRYVSEAKTIKERAPKEFERIKSGKATISAVARQLKKDKPEQLPKQSVPKSVAGAVKILKGEQFDVIFADQEGLLDLCVRQVRWYVKKLLRHITTSDAILLMTYRIDETLPDEIEGAQFLTSVVLETDEGTHYEAFNMDVRHRQLAIYAWLNDEIPNISPERPITSLCKTNDALDLIATWFPNRNKLLLSDTLAPERWTQLSPKNIIAGGVKR